MDSSSSLDDDEAEVWEDNYLVSLKNQKLLERTGILPPDSYMVRQSYINGKMRSVLVDWLAGVVQFLKLRSDIFYSCVNIVDAYLARKDVLRSNLQLLGVAAVSLSAKYNNSTYPDLVEYCLLSDEAYTKEQIIKMEKEVFIVLGCDLGGIPIDLNYLRALSSMCGASQKEHNMSKYLLSIIKVYVQPFLPSVYATAIRKIAAYLEDGKYTNIYKVRDAAVNSCMSCVVKLCNTIHASKLQGYKKLDKRSLAEWSDFLPRVCALKIHFDATIDVSEYYRATYYKEHLQLALIVPPVISAKPQKLGRGVYSTVLSLNYKGTQYAVKKMRPELTREGIPHTVLREISLGLLLDHPNVAKIRYLSEDLGSIFFDLGVSDMYQWFVGNGPLSRDMQKVFAIQMFEALAYIHGMGCMHRDIKPQNIICYGSYDKPRFVLSDFGLARGPGITLKNDTFNKEVITLWYRPPELFLGSPVYNASVDIWSMLCVLYEVSTGKPLFDELSELEMLTMIFRFLGTPNDSTWEGVEDLPFYIANGPTFRGVAKPFSKYRTLSKLSRKILTKGLKTNPNLRPTAKEVLKMLE